MRNLKSGFTLIEILCGILASFWIGFSALLFFVGELQSVSRKQEVRTLGLEKNIQEFREWRSSKTKKPPNFNSVLKN